MKYRYEPIVAAFVVFTAYISGVSAEIEKRHVQDTLQRGLTIFRGQLHSQQSNHTGFEFNKLEVAICYRYNITLDVSGGRTLTLEVMDDPKWTPLLLPAVEGANNLLVDSLRREYTEGDDSREENIISSSIDDISSAVIGSLQIPPFIVHGPAEIILRQARRDILFSLPHSVDAGVSPVNRIILQDGVQARISGIQSVSLHSPVRIDLALPPKDQSNLSIDMGRKLSIVVDSLSEVFVAEKAKLHRMELKGKPGKTVTIVSTSLAYKDNQTKEQRPEKGELSASIVPSRSRNQVVIDKTKAGALENIIRSHLPFLPHHFIIDWIQRAEIKMARLFRLPAKEHAIYDSISQSFIKELIISDSRDRGTEVLPVLSTETPMGSYHVSLPPILNIGDRNVTYFTEDAGWYPHFSPVIQYPN